MKDTNTRHDHIPKECPTLIAVDRILSEKMATGVYSPQLLRKLYAIKNDRTLYMDDAIESKYSMEIPDDWTQSIPTFIDLINEWNYLDRDIPKEERQPIRIKINSPGGEMYEGFALVDAIESSETPVYTYNMGMAASMAFFAFIAGHRRFSQERAVFLMHDGHVVIVGSSGKSEDLADFLKEYKNTVIKPFVLKHSNMTAKKYASVYKDELWMRADTAMELGFVDEIMTDVSVLF